MVPHRNLASDTCFLFYICQCNWGLLRIGNPIECCVVLRFSMANSQELILYPMVMPSCYFPRIAVFFYLLTAKGQLISKPTYGLLTSPKKRTDEFDLFAFLLFTANKSNSSVRFFGESTAR